MKVLLAVDGSEYSRASVALMKRLSMPKDCEVIVVTVLGTGASFGGDGFGVLDTEIAALESYREDALVESRRMLSAIADELGEAGWTVRTRTEHGHTADRIVATANELGVDHIVVGSHGMTGFDRFLLGSVSRAVVTHAPCSVLVVRKPADTQDAGTRELISRRADSGHPLRILAAFDGSPSARAAIELLRTLPLRADSELTVVTVLTVATTLYGKDILQRLSTSWQEHSRAAQLELESVLARLKQATPNVFTKLIDDGTDASPDILRLATDLEVDIVVLGSTGTSAIERFLLGSVTARVLDHAPCSVWVVR
ncbi:MAG TPA: universal stress protein [Vicinamibacteria bacterium]|nr:universal stress protein [Vicinamibacteria bacterium]